MDRVRRALAWLYRQRKGAKRWIIRIVSFYFGYKMLHHEVYQVDSPEPLLIALGLWLCGIAPADIFDGLRKMGDAADIDPTGKRESSSGDKK